MLQLPHIHKPSYGVKLNRHHSVVQSLTGYWLFNEYGGGTAFDSLGSNNGAVQSSVQWQGQGLDFNETGDYVNCGNAGNFLRSKGTIFFQYKWLAEPISFYYWFVLDDDYSEFSLLADPANTFSQFYVSSTQSQFTDSLSQTINGECNSIAITWDADVNVRKLYINGIFIVYSGEVFTWNSAGIADHDFLIGGRLTGADRHAGGEVNHFGICDKVLTDAEIISLHHQPYQIFEPMFIPSAVISTGSTLLPTKGNYAALPSDDTALETEFTSQEETDIETDNDVFVEQAATGEYSVFLLKNQNDNNTDNIELTCKVKSTMAASLSTIYLQIYNRNSTSWETIDSEASAAAGAEFELSGTQSANLSYYYDGSYIVACRIYQEAL